MKKMFTVVFSLLALGCFAASREEAQALYANRGENPDNAKLAADIYLALFNQSESEFEKSEFKRLESEASYYYGLKQGTRDGKLAQYERGYEAAAQAFSYLESAKGVPKLPEWSAALSDAYYLYSANMGKFGEAKGVLSSLTRWRLELRPHLHYILNLGEAAKSNRSYGALRILGRAYIKVPFESSSEGLAFLKEAYDKTVETFEIAGEEMTTSRHVNNLVFYIEGLRKLGEDNATFCKLYEKAEYLYDISEEEELLKEYNPDLVPETKTELKNFFDEEDNSEYYDEVC